jgi:hypothetical protein
MKKIILLSLFAIVLSSCRSQVGVSNGAYSDISLNRDSKDYTINRLKEINSESNAIFGIPTDKSMNKKQGLIVRFNGINLTASKRFWPIVSMVGLTFVTGKMISAAGGFKEETIKTGSGSYTYEYTLESDKPKIGMGLASIIALPISGFINNQLWDGSLSRASWEANSKLLQDNDGIDVFLNPKYDIDVKRGIWTQNAKLKLRVMGAKIKTDN